MLDNFINLYYIIYVRTTTIKIYDNDLQVWKRWCKHYNFNSSEMMAELMRRVELKQQESFYNSLPMPVKTVKPLIGIKINKKYIKE